MIGVIEIFFGPAWSKENRLSLADFFQEHGFEFYLYGPKSDSRLRKSWMEEWSPEYLREIAELGAAYRRRGIKFGVVLSPYGLHEGLGTKFASQLSQKTQQLESCGVEMIGIFFDDMPNAEGLASRQVQCIQKIQAVTSLPLIFCPTFYSFDPILDRVFGARSPDYLNEIGREVPRNVEILWTGPKVISDEIPPAHLEEVTAILHRKPFICDNLFANDGPRNCKFIKYRAPLSRTPASLDACTHWAFNPMNQAELSKHVLLTAMLSLRSGIAPERALAEAREILCTPDFSRWLGAHRTLLFESGLDKITEVEKGSLCQSLTRFSDPAAHELIDWLNGKFAVGADCLTD